MAPAPVAEKEASAIPYPEGIAIVKKALGTVSPELSGFLDTMLENRWVDAKPSEKKISGAFYSRFNEFRIPRVFASYTGTITTVLQQAHELGHAFHYWMMRDLPVVQTEFPMTLTETASTFNEGVLRHHLQAEALAKKRPRSALRHALAGTAQRRELPHDSKLRQRVFTGTIGSVDRPPFFRFGAILSEALPILFRRQPNGPT